MSLARKILRPPRGPFAFPGGKARFDPSRIGAAGISAGRGISCVAMGSGFSNLLNGKQGTVVGTPAAAMNGTIGPCARSAAGSTSSFTFAGNSATNDFASTFAAIAQFDGFSTTQGIIQNDNVSGTGIGIRVSNVGVLQFVCSAVSSTSSSITLSANIPYLLLVSPSGAAGTVNFVAVRLDTGVVVTSTATAPASSSAPNGTYVVANSTAANQGMGGILAAAMFSPRYTPMPSLLQWAASPWSFWYAP